MYKKRGLLVVVVLVLIIFSSLSVIGFTKYKMVRLLGGCETDSSCASSDWFSLNFCINLGNCEQGSCDELDGTEMPKSFPPSDTGCYMNVVERDDWTDPDGDDCGWGIIYSGFISRVVS